MTKTYVYPGMVIMTATSRQEAEKYQTEGARIDEYVQDSKTGLVRWECMFSRRRAAELGYAPEAP